MNRLLQLFPGASANRHEHVLGSGSAGSAGSPDPEASASSGPGLQATHEPGPEQETTSSRLELLRALGDARGGRTVISYVTSTRPQLAAPMAADAIPVIHEHLRELRLSREHDRIDLFLHTDGGDGMVPWRLMTLLREFAKEVCVLVPHRCFSAGTLTALGADEILMHPMGILGPTDPTSHTDFNPTHPIDSNSQVGVAVEDVTSYVKLVREDVGVTTDDQLLLAFSMLAQQVHPLALGNVKRLSNQMQLMGKRMLALRERDPVEDPDGVVRRLNSELFAHSHPINRSEARKDIGLSFVTDPPSVVEEAMWRLYEAYARDMRLHQEFDLFAETAEQTEPPPPPPWSSGATPPPPAVRVVTLRNLKYVYVESGERSDCREFDYEITASRQWDGAMNVESVITGDRWRTLRPSEG